MAGTATIRFVTRKFPPAMGGMETWSAEIARRLGERVPLDLVALPGRPDGSAPGALALIGFGLRTALRLLTASRARAVLVGDLASWPFALVSWLRHPGCRIVLAAHGSDVSYATRGHWKGALYGRYLRLGARLLRGARVIANSRFVAEAARAQGFAEVAVVPLGTAVEPPVEVPPTGDHLLFAGRIMCGKGLRFLVEEVLPLLPDPPRLRVAGTIWDADEAAALSSPLVDYLGPLDRPALAREYAAAAAIVVPTQIPEGFGLVAVEAAACGGVVIAADHSGLRDAVLPGHGFLVGARPSDWAAAIADVRAMPHAARVAFVAASAKAARARFSWDRVAEETLAVIEASGPA